MERLNKMLHYQRKMKNKENELLIHVTTWVDPKGIMLREKTKSLHLSIMYQFILNL